MADHMQTNGDDEEVIVLDAPTNMNAQIEFINRKRLRVIQAFAQQSKRARRVPDMTTEPAKSLHRQLGALIRWLDEEVQMTPHLCTKTKIDVGLKLIFSHPDFHFLEADRDKAKELYDKWEEEDWGKDEVVDEGIEDEGEEANESERSERPPTKRRRTSTNTASRDDDDEKDVVTLRLPPLNHPIFGVDGIMHGVAIRRGKRKTPVLDPRFSKRHAKVYGHNQLAVGSWFASRFVALFRGAHGATQGGIAGNSQQGAYSIVVSGEYHELDQDYGKVLYYSGSNSHDNEDPTSPARSSNGTLALQTSMALEKPVRVLCTSSGNKEFAPVVGIRYDGLYQIVSTRHRTNTKGGLYEQFKLRRIEGQPPIDGSRPTREEIRDLQKCGAGYRCMQS